MAAQAWITLVAGLLAVAGVVLTVGQRTRSDNRAQSWQRISWCLERSISDNPSEVQLGWSLFGIVAATPFIARTDRDTLRTISDYAAASDLAKYSENADNGTVSDPEEKA